MSVTEMNNYRLTSMEEPGDERLAQIMREVAEEARKTNSEAKARINAGIIKAISESRNKWSEKINRLRNG